MSTEDPGSRSPAPSAERDGPAPRPAARPPLPGTVWLLGWASLLNDVSSEATFPLLGPFLTTLGAPMQFVGLALGAADTLGVGVRILVGRASDRWRRRPLVVGGYLLPAAARGLLSVAVHPWQVLVTRALDRGGKAIRSGPRDAVLADAVDARDRGRAFGFTQAMDHVGAAIGPLIASLCLARGLSFRATFALAAGLGVLAPLLLAFRLPEVPRTKAAPVAPSKDAPPATVGRPLVGYLVAVGLFALANASDAFILIRAQQLGWAAAALPLLWLGHHLIKAATTAVGGLLSDRVPRWTLIAGGWLAYGATYWGLSLARTPLQLALLLGAYALYHGLAEGTERALVSDLVGSGKRGAAFGLYHGVVGGVALPAGLLMGRVWDKAGAGAAFRVEALFAFAATVMLVGLVATGRLGRFPARDAKRR